MPQEWHYQVFTVLVQNSVGTSQWKQIVTRVMTNRVQFEDVGGKKNGTSLVKHFWCYHETNSKIPCIYSYFIDDHENYSTNHKNNIFFSVFQMELFISALVRNQLQLCFEQIAFLGRKKPLAMSYAAAPAKAMMAAVAKKAA